jgi:two-component system, NarL family, response regulator NreC
MKTTIAIADDHELVRKSIVSLLRNETDFEVIGECSTGRQLLDIVESSRPNVAIVDVAMPELNGIDATYRIRSISPATRVIVLSNYTDDVYVKGTFEAGAVGYIVKSGAVNDLIQAVRNASRGKVYLSPEVSNSIANPQELTKHEYSPHNRTLSSREREVLQLIAEGKSSKEIAMVLGISETTVKSHRNNIKIKLDINDIAGLTRYAIRIGLIRAE